MILMLKKLDLGITPYIENISSRDQSLVRMGTSRVTLSIAGKEIRCCHYTRMKACSKGYFWILVKFGKFKLWQHNRGIMEPLH